MKETVRIYAPYYLDPDKFKFYINFQQDYFNEAFHNAIFEKFKDYIDENLEVKLRNTNIKTNINMQIYEWNQLPKFVMMKT